MMQGLETLRKSEENLEAEREDWGTRRMGLDGRGERSDESGGLVYRIEKH